MFYAKIFRQKFSNCSTPTVFTSQCRKAACNALWSSFSTNTSLFSFFSGWTHLRKDVEKVTLAQSLLVKPQTLKNGDLAASSNLCQNWKLEQKVLLIKQN